MPNIEKQFINFSLARTKEGYHSDMEALLKTKFKKQANHELTPSDMIEFIITFFSYVEPEHVTSFDDVLDENGNVIPNYQQFDMKLAS